MVYLKISYWTFIFKKMDNHQNEIKKIKEQKTRNHQSLLK